MTVLLRQSEEEELEKVPDKEEDAGYPFDLHKGEFELHLMASV